LGELAPSAREKIKIFVQLGPCESPTLGELFCLIVISGAQ